MTTYEPVDIAAAGQSVALQGSVAIPFPSQDDASLVLRDVYSGVFRRMQVAVDEQDLPLLEALLEAYDKPGLPRHYADAMRSFRGMARGIAFQRHAARSARIIAVGAAAPPLGERLGLVIELPAMGEPVQLGGRNDRDPIGFGVAVTIEDEFVDGGFRSLHSEEFFWLPAARRLAGEDVLQLPIEVDPAADQVVRRTVYARVDLMPGHVEVDGVRAPVRRVSIAAAAWTQWPEGYDVVARDPLAALRSALARFGPRSFATAYVAAASIAADQREQAIDLLIDQVRHGTADQARVAMAALRHVAAVRLPLGDRDAWLAWWQARR